MNVLPAELIEYVIDELQYDTNSLRSCSLVCKSWLPRTSAHLFKSLSAHFLVETYEQPDLWKAPFYGFYTLITTSVRIAAHVQVLHITIRPSTVADVATIAIQLPQLRSLFVGGTLLTIAPSSLPPSCSGRRIEYLCVHQARADVIPYFLGLFASVGTLEVHSCNVDNQPPSTSLLLTHLVQHLHIWHVPGNVVRYLATLLEPSALEGINISLIQTWEPIHLDDLSQLLSIAGRSLRSLEVEPDYRSSGSTVRDLSALRECAHLESITITAFWSFVLGEDWWRGLLIFLPVLPPATRAVRIEISLMGGRSCIPDGVLREVDWSAVGSALEHCSGLQHLHVGVRGEEAVPFSSPKYRSLRETIIPELPSRLRGVVRFD